MYVSHIAISWLWYKRSIEYCARDRSLTMRQMFYALTWICPRKWNALKIIIIITLLASFPTSVSWSFSTEVWTTASPLVSRTLLCILVDGANAVVWMVWASSLISNSSKSSFQVFRDCSKRAITIGFIITLMFHNFLISLARSKYMSFFSHSLIFPRWYAKMTKSKIQ